MSYFKFKQLPEMLTGSEVRIIEYIYKNKEQMPFMPIKELAEELKTSTATLSRFAKNMGYKDLRQLKLDMLKAERISPDKKMKNVIDVEEDLSVSSLLEREINHLQTTLKQIDAKQIEKAIECTKNAGCVYVYGKGASKGLAYLLEFRLKRFGIDTRMILGSGSEIFEDLASMKEKDVLILYGFGKMPVEVKILLDFGSRLKCQTILFADGHHPELSSNQLIVLSSYRGEAQEYHSMTSPTALTDIFLLLLGKHMGEDSLARMNQLFDLKETYRNQMPR